MARCGVLARLGITGLPKPRSAGGLETQLGWRSGASHAALKRKNVRNIMVTGKRVDLGLFKGTDLEDLKGLFEGSGKGMRHIKIHKVEDN